MIKADQTPNQVIAAFDHAFLEERQSGWTLDMAYRHAFAAGLAAWPEGWTQRLLLRRNTRFLILPLTQENNNADG